MRIRARSWWSLLIAAAWTIPVVADDELIVIKPSDAKKVAVKRGHVPSYPRVFTGKISDNEGKAVSGALIEWGPDYPPDAPRETTPSAQDGSYRLEMKRAGARYKLGVSAAGFAPYWQEGLIPGPRSAPSEIPIKLAPESTIKVSVLSEAGTPIPGLEIQPMTPQTGFNSSFSMVQQPEPIPGHDKPTRCDEQALCELRQLLIPPGPLQAAAAGETPAAAQARARFNEQGWLSLTIMRNGQWVHEHQISRREYFEARGHFKITVPNYRNPLIEATYNGSIFGQIVGADGSPVKQYLVTLRHRPEPMFVSDPEGRFQWGSTLNPNNEYQVRIFASGFEPQVVKMTPSKTSEANPQKVELRPHKSAEFQLIDGKTQKPVPDLLVVTGVARKGGFNYMEWNDLVSYADGHHGLENVVRLKTDAQGRITVPEGKDPATLIILASKYARLIVPPAQRPASGEKGPIQITLEPGASIQVVSTTGSRISQQGDGISLHFFSTDGFDHMFHGLKRDGTGECLISSLAAGDYLVSLMHSDGNLSTACWTKRVSLRPGERLRLPVGELTGKLTLSGRTSPFQHVRISPHSGDNDPRANARQRSGVTTIATFADIDGYFEINQVEAGQYRIEIGGLSRFSPRLGLAANKGPAEVILSEDTHIDYVAGSVVPPGAAVATPELKN